MAENSIIDYSNIIGADDTFKVLYKNLDELEARVLKLAKDLDGKFSVVNPNDTKQIEAYEKQVKELEQAVKNLTKQREVAAKAQKQNIELTQEQLVQIETEKIRRREQIAIAKQQAIIQREEKNNIASLRAQLSLVTLEWKKLTAEEADNTIEGRKLVAEKLRLTNQLKALEKATGDNRREVGNYALALGKVKDASENLRGTFLRLSFGRDIIRGIFQSLVGIVENGKDANSSLKAISDSANSVKSAFQLLGSNLLEFLAPAITFVFGLLAKIPAVFNGIVEAGKQLSSNLGEQFERISVRLQIAFLQIEKANPFSDKSTAEINKNIDSLRKRLATLSEDNRGILQAFKDGYNATLNAQKKFADNQAEQAVLSEKLKASEEARTKQLERQKTLLSEINVLQSERLRAIEDLQKQITELETQNIKDRQDKLLALEALKLQEENKLREENFTKTVDLIEQQEAKLIELYGENSKQVLEFRAKTDTELLTLEKDNQKLSEEQLKASEQRKIEIRKEFALATEEIQPINVLKKQSEKEAEILNAQVDLVEETNGKKKESYDELFKSISETTQKIGSLITETFEKQADLAKENVDKQVSAVEDARERARLGLENNLKFEQEELAKREAEQQRAQKRAQQAAKLTALFNIVAAAAASGDKDAVINGIVQFGLLEAFSAAIEGSFYDGTEELGKAVNPLDSKGGRLIVAHDEERILPKFLNRKLGGAKMDNVDLVENALLGQHLRDSAPNLIGAEHYAAQANSLQGSHKSDSNQDIKQLASIMNEVKRAIINKPTNSDDLIKVTSTSFEVSRKVVEGKMTRESKIKKYL